MTNSYENPEHSAGQSDWQANGLEGPQAIERRVPSRETQALELIQFQMEQRAGLQKAGVLERAAELARVDAESQAVHPYVRVTRELHENGEVEVTEVAFTVTENNSSGNIQRRTAYAPVAETLSGVTMSRNGFTDEQAELIVGMADVLRNAKETGELPNLASDLSEIV